MKRKSIPDLMEETDTSDKKVDKEELGSLVEMSEALLKECAEKISKRFNIPYAFALFGLGIHASSMCEEFVVVEDEKEDMN